MSADITVPAAARRSDLLEYAVSGGILACLAAMIAASLTRNVNWDEFYFLSHVHAAVDGRLDRPMQTFFVHFFGWLARIPGTEVDQIAAARLVMVVLVVLTCASIHRIAAEFADPFSCRVAVLAYLASGFVLAHGASFRADPIAASLLMMALAVLMTTAMRTWHVAAVAILCALAVLVTVKSVLWLPAFLGALLYRWPVRSVVARGILAGVLALVVAAVLYFWHASTMTVAEANATATNAREALGKTLLSGAILPRWNETLLWAMLSFPALVLAGLALLRAAPARQLALLGALAAPVLSVLVYRNAYPYFFPFITPPLMVLVAIGAAWLHRQGRLAPMVAALLALALVQALMSLREGNAVQRATLAEVHRLFPDPVPYIDQHRMVASFPGQGFFMSSWGIESYRREGIPVFGAILAEARPPFLLANRPELLQAVREGVPRPGALLPEDRKILAESFVHHAGAIWLAGRALTGTGVESEFAMPLAGRYRLDATGPVVIDGKRVMPGEVVTLDKRAHVLLAPLGQSLRLVWATAGDETPAPDLPEDGLYSGFWRL